MTSKPLIVIPARMAAVRLPNKPMALIHNKPMIQHVWERAVAANIGPVVVACCGDEIADLIRGLGGTVVITDTDLPSGTDRVWAAAKKYADTDIIINVQGDLPFIKPEAIIEPYKVLEQNKDVDIATPAVITTDKNEYTMASVVKIAMTMYESKRGRALYFSRSPIPYGAETIYHHLGVYAFRRAALEKFVSLPPSSLELSEKLEQLRALEAGMRIDVTLVDNIPKPVDTQEDLDFLNSMNFNN